MILTHRFIKSHYHRVGSTPTLPTTWFLWINNINLVVYKFGIQYIIQTEFGTLEFKTYDVENIGQFYNSGCGNVGMLTAYSVFKECKMCWLYLLLSCLFVTSSKFWTLCSVNQLYCTLCCLEQEIQTSCSFISVYMCKAVRSQYIVASPNDTDWPCKHSLIHCFVETFMHICTQHKHPISILYKIWRSYKDILTF